jgi:hypothetical protein
MSLWISEHMSHILFESVLLEFNQYLVIYTLYLLNVAIAFSTSRGLGSGTNGLAVFPSP